MTLPSVRRFGSPLAGLFGRRRRLSSPSERLGAAAYHENVLDHFQNPRNVGSLDRKSRSVGTGVVGSPACGDVMKLQIQVDEGGRIVDAKFKTFGCGSAIASSSLATEWMKGKSLDDSLRIRNTHIARELRLPPVKLHCSMLAEDALRAAVRDYRLKQREDKGGGGEGGGGEEEEEEEEEDL